MIGKYVRMLNQLERTLSAPLSIEAETLPEVIDTTSPSTYNGIGK